MHKVYHIKFNLSLALSYNNSNQNQFHWLLNGISVLFTSHPKNGLVVNSYIPKNRRTTRQAEEAIGPISMPRGSQELKWDR
jgi:hypothetical protein